MTIEDFNKLELPDTPGIYFWKQGSDILYIGKATSLRDRVRSYFASDLIATRGPRIVDMVFKTDQIEWQETDSVLEALIAEANQIKKHLPQYNVMEKDDKSFNYVVITKEDFPRVLVIRGRTLDVEKKKKELKVKKSFGPFVSGSSLRAALKIIRKMFPFADKGSLGRDKYHFYRQLGLTPDINSTEAKADYAKTVKHIILFFEGKKKELVRELEKEMKAYAKSKEFEKAGEIKRKLFALDHIQDVALIKEDIANIYSADAAEAEGAQKSGFRIEAYDTAHMSGKESAGVMTVIVEGEPDKNEYRKFKLSPRIGNNDTASLREIIERRLNHPEWRFPDIMVIDGGEGQKNVAEAVLAARGIVNINIVAVVKDERHKPRDIAGPADLIEKHKKAILLANSEAHRFAIAYHRKLRRMNNQLRGKL